MSEPLSTEARRFVRLARTEIERLREEPLLAIAGRSDISMEDAARIAYRELVRWIAPGLGVGEDEAYMLLTMCGKVRLGNMVDPKYTLGASIAKKYLG